MTPFHGPRAKIARARRHLGELGDVISAYLAANPYKLVIQDDPRPDLVRITIVSNGGIPVETSLLLGDAVHNLRSALDLMACDLVRLNDRSAKGVYFPIARSELELDAQIKDKNFRRAGPDAIALVRQLRPYAGGNDAIVGIHAIDIMDKHQLLVPVATIVAAQNATLIRDGKTANVLFSTLKAQDYPPPDGVLAKIPKAIGFAPGDVIPGSFDVSFGPDTFFRGEKPVDLLGQIADHFEAVVEAFAAHFLAGSEAPPLAPFIRRKRVSPEILVIT